MLQRYAASSAAAHGLDVLAVLERLRKVADVAGDVDVAFHREWYDGDEAKGEPGIRLDHLRSVVAAVVAAAHDAFIALDFLPEGVLATREYETHTGGGVAALCAAEGPARSVCVVLVICV